MLGFGLVDNFRDNARAGELAKIADHKNPLLVRGLLRFNADHLSLKESAMDRRDFVVASTLALTLAKASSAEASKSAPVAGADASAGFDGAKLIATSGRCVSTGLICIKHCEKELAAGNKEMAECLRSVLELVATCDTLQKLAAYDSSFTRDYAKLTAKVCSTCAKLCDKHAQHMEACKNCRDACLECEKACLAA